MLALAVAIALPLPLAACGKKHTTATTTAAAATTTTSVKGHAAQTSDVFSRIPSIVTAVQPEVVTVLTPQGVGSGVIYRSNGVILTNDHVVHGHSTVEVAFADGRRLPGKVLAADAATDLALVKVDRRGLPAASFQSKLPAVGSLAVVLGSPLGFDKSVSAGIVSGLHRSIPGSARETAALVDLSRRTLRSRPVTRGARSSTAKGA